MQHYDNLNTEQYESPIETHFVEGKKVTIATNGLKVENIRKCDVVLPTVRELKCFCGVPYKNILCFFYRLDGEKRKLTAFTNTCDFIQQRQLAKREEDKILQEAREEFGDDLVEVEMTYTPNFLFRDSFLKSLTHMYSTDRAVYMNGFNGNPCQDLRIELGQTDRHRLVGTLMERYGWYVSDTKMLKQG